jgi:hypothetical protein
MSTQYNGLSANVTASSPAPVTITSSVASGSDCLFLTAAPHLLTTGDEVSINGHTINAVANVQAIATVVDATHFTIPVTVFGTGSGGTVQSLAFGATYAIPSDGDALDATSVNVALEALGDRTAFLEQAVPIAKLVLPTGADIGDDTFATWSHIVVGSMSLDTWTDVVANVVSSPWTLNPSVHAGDEVTISLDLNYAITGAGGSATLAQFGLFYRLSYVGAGGYTRLDGATRMTRIEASQIKIDSVHLSASFFAANAGTLELKLMGYADQTIPAQWSHVGDYNLRCTVLRGTGAPPA